MFGDGQQARHCKHGSLWPLGDALLLEFACSVRIAFEVQLLAAYYRASKKSPPKNRLRLQIQFYRAPLIGTHTLCNADHADDWKSKRRLLNAKSYNWQR